MSEPTVKLRRFTCPGAGRDAPREGYEIVESEDPRFQPGEFLVSTEEPPEGSQVLPEEPEESFF